MQSIAHCRGELSRAAYRLTGDGFGAEDLLQESLLRAWTASQEQQVEGNIRAWLHRILRNTFLSQERRRDTERQYLQRETAYWESKHVTEGTADTLGSRAMEALELLPKAYREVVRLVDVEGYSYEAAAAHLACPLGTVMSRLYRGRRLLRRQIAKHSCVSD